MLAILSPCRFSGRTNSDIWRNFLPCYIFSVLSKERRSNLNIAMERPYCSPILPSERNSVSLGTYQYICEITELLLFWVLTCSEFTLSDSKGSDIFPKKKRYFLLGLEARNFLAINGFAAIFDEEVCKLKLLLGKGCQVGNIRRWKP